MLNDLGKILFIKLQELREESGGQIDINNIDSIVENFMEVIKTHVNSDEDIKVFSEIEKIADQIKATKQEVASVDPDKMQEDFPDALNQLQSVTKATEKSTEDILQATEDIQNIIANLDNADVKKEINERCFKIMEACSFQDLTGQRISKVVKTIDEIESTICKLITTFKPDKEMQENSKICKTKEEELLNGPQLENKAPSQQDIDDLFNSL